MNRPDRADVRRMDVKVNGIAFQSVRLRRSSGLARCSTSSSRTPFLATFRRKNAFSEIFEYTSVRLNVEENQLVNVFDEFRICLGDLKSA
jgi:hypothetical protein